MRLCAANSRAYSLTMGILVLGFAAWLASAAPASSSLEHADDAFTKKRYEAALTEYEAVLKEKPGDPRALLRAATCEALLYRYAEAADRLARAKPPTEPRWRARFLLLEAELAREYLKQYGNQISDTVEEGTSDVTRKAPERWKSEIEAAFAELWKMREGLGSVPIREEGDLMDLKGSDLELAPTFADLVGLRFTGYLASQESERKDPTPRPKPEAEALLSKEFATAWSADLSPGAQAAAIGEALSLMPRKGRELASELWKLGRMELPFTSPELVKMPSEPDELKRFRARAAETFEGLAFEFEQPRSRGLAGFRAASILNEDAEYERAVQLCKRIEKLAKGTSGAFSCAELRASIEMPRVSLEVYPVPPGGKDAFRLTARNVDEVYFRAYKTTLEELEGLEGRARARYGGAGARNFSHLRQI